MMDLKFRLAEPADLPRIQDIYESARRFMAENGNPSQWTDGYPDTAVVTGDMARRQLYVCTENGAILGVFCCFCGIEPDYLEIYEGSWPNDKPYGVVHRIAVAARKRGIASACLDFAFSRCGNLRIDTHRDNLPMQRTLAKNGFLRCGIVRCSHGGERIAYQKTN